MKTKTCSPRPSAVRLVGFIIGMACFALADGELDSAVLHGETDKERAIDYQPGETMTFTLQVQGAQAIPQDTYFIRWTRTGDDGLVENGKAPVSLTEPLVVKTKLDKPGFVRVEASVVDRNGKEYRKQFRGDPNTPEGKRALNAFERMDKRIFFDGGAGVQPETLQSVPEPADFDAFWARRRARLAKVPLAAERTELEHYAKNEKVYAVSIRCAGPRPSTGYLAVPVKPGKYPIRVSFHGYGHTYPNKGHVISPILGYGNCISFNFSPHGYELGREPEYYDEFFRSICSGGYTFGFDPKQNADPETSYFSGYTYRIMRALEWLKTLPEWDGKNLIVEGGSMGGLQSVWAAGLDPDVSLARPSIPWCCDMGGRDTLKRIVSSWYIHETPALRYYDPVNLAKRISKTCRVEIVRAGLGDYCCPPSGVAVLFNNIPGPKKINWVQGSTHGYVPPEKHQAFSVTGNGWTQP
ncbi:MAG: acetylxylan esterase [Kiritimatiellae bacterium]|nr:acetylxylan esterase [Kiritimatiellia bacterium]